ncbi:Protein of unknown function [Gryllus bimaculatus]|nr:Protein of unknown function [Gryllus bimaculatus]
MAFANARARRCWPLAAGFDSPRAGLLDAASLALCVGAGGRVSLGALRWKLTDRRVDAAAARRSTERNGADYPDAGPAAALTVPGGQAVAALCIWRPAPQHSCARGPGAPLDGGPIHAYGGKGGIVNAIEWAGNGNGKGARAGSQTLGQMASDSGRLMGGNGVVDGGPLDGDHGR